MTPTEIRAAIRADILAHTKHFTWNEANREASRKYGDEIEGVAMWRIVDRQLQALRKQGQISTHRDGRLSFWTVIGGQS